MVTSIDGSTVFGDTSAGLSSNADRDVLLTLRSFADIIIVGAGTVRSEGYGIPKKPNQRIGVVSRTGMVDLDSALFSSGAGFLIVPEDAPACRVESVRAGVGELDLVAAMGRLPGNPRFVQAEGGPMLNGALATANLVDEINLTTSPQVIGGHGPRLLRGAAALTTRYQLMHLLEDEGFLFSRYVRSDSGLV
jgi:riboflavin biosynthesis pyrimidine reductase